MYKGIYSAIFVVIICFFISGETNETNSEVVIHQIAKKKKVNIRDFNLVGQ